LNPKQIEKNGGKADGFACRSKRKMEGFLDEEERSLLVSGRRTGILSRAREK